MKIISHLLMLSNTQIYIVDFNDSFTFNIANVLFPYGYKLSVINYKNFFEDSFDEIINQKGIAIILGPGPGHPEQYTEYFSKINKIINNSHIYLMGICLGHQLISSQMGYQILSSVQPKHGEQVVISWEGESFGVQRYNSLAVVSRQLANEISLNNEVMILKYKNGQSYQFHPESIGTEKSAHFFKDLLSFLALL